MNEPADYLLKELYAARRETRRWRQRAEWLEQSRDHWRDEAKVWKWGALHRPRDSSTASTGLRTA